jgi:lia operon protein LiaG
LSAEIDAETGSGGFSTDFEVTTRRVGRNHISGRIGDGKGRISIEAGSGSVRLLKN